MISPAGFRKVVKYTVPAVTVGAPAVYMIHFHDKFYSKTEGRVKMFNKQLGFWGGMSAGLYLIHRNLRKFKTNKKLFALCATVMAFAPYLGVQLAKLANKIIYPINMDDLHSKHQYRRQNNQVKFGNNDFDSFIKATRRNNT